MTVECTKKDITKMEAIIGSQNRLRTLASDFIEHWEMRRSNTFSKCMIVATFRKICLDLYNEIVKEIFHRFDYSKYKSNSALDCASVIKLETEDKRDNPKKLTQAQINEKIASLMAKTIISEDVIDVYS